jgi:hypothetical protein
MFIITVDGHEEQGAYSAKSEDGHQILYMFEQEDDASRFAMMLEDKDFPKMRTMEIDADILIQACEGNGYEYAIFTSNDIVIPPDNIEEDDFI